jgi:hypothetical protein
MDDLEECKKQNWLIVMDSKTEQSVKVQALKELLILSNSYGLIVKDLPFVTLTKYYDRNLRYSNYIGEREDSKEKMFDKENQNSIKV